MLKIFTHAGKAVVAQLQRNFAPIAVGIALMNQPVRCQQARHDHDGRRAGLQRLCCTCDRGHTIFAGEQAQQQFPTVFTKELTVENGGAKLDHGSGGEVLLRAA